MPIDLHGKTFGRLTVITTPGSNKRGEMLWTCRCQCGAEKTVTSTLLRDGRVRSCGCLRRELGIVRGQASRRHGEASNSRESPEYRTWANMLSRCNNPNHSIFESYGGRGITVCERWKVFENFLADMGRRPPGTVGKRPKFSLDRIDNSQGYSPGNCRWATWEEQNSNQRHRHSAHMITINGVTKSLQDWIVQTDITKHVFRQRIRRGMTEQAALFTPLDRGGYHPSKSPDSSLQNAKSA